MKWLHKMANSDAPRLTTLMDFTHTSCLFSTHRNLFPGYSKMWVPKRCSAENPPPWQHTAIGVEFHAYSRRRYWEELVPKLPELRRMYAEANGTVLTIATFREPVSHVLSTYRMWPPSQRCKCGREKVGKHVVPLPEWLPIASGLQAGSLTLDSWPHQKRGFHNLRGCASVPQGRERLQTFDVVGVMDCMHDLLAAVCRALDWPCAEDETRLEAALRHSLKFKPRGVSSGGVLMREAAAWGHLDALNASVRAMVHSAADCDRPMYDDAIRRMGITAPMARGTPLNQSSCAAATYVRTLTS